MDVAIVSGLFALSAAIFTVAAQVWLQRKEQHKRDSDRIKSERLKVISDLVSHRYVIAGRPNSRGVAQFNAALNRIPIEFLEHKDIIDLYHAIGTDFDAEKFHKLIIALLDVTLDRPRYLDHEVLSLTPSVKFNPPEFTINIPPR